MVDQSNAEARAFLEEWHGEDFRADVYDLDSPSVTIGWRAGNRIRVLDEIVSGSHAAIEYSTDQSQWIIRDLDSLNGTTVDGVPLQEGEDRPLTIGQKIEIPGLVGWWLVFRADFGPLPDPTDRATPTEVAYAVGIEDLAKRRVKVGRRRVQLAWDEMLIFGALLDAHTRGEPAVEKDQLLELIGGQTDRGRLLRNRDIGTAVVAFNDWYHKGRDAQLLKRVLQQLIQSLQTANIKPIDHPDSTPPDDGTHQRVVWHLKSKLDTAAKLQGWKVSLIKTTWARAPFTDGTYALNLQREPVRWRRNPSVSE